MMHPGRLHRAQASALATCGGPRSEDVLLPEVQQLANKLSVLQARRESVS